MKELRFNEANVAQDTNWYCGPASIQNAISVHGKFMTERDIATKTEALEGNVGWDDRDGTDHIRQITQVLNEILGNPGYVTRLTPNDPMTKEQKSLMRSEVLASIDNGYAVVMNWVVPGSNRPIGQLGSRSPNYGPGPTFHYITVVGYRVVDGKLYLKIADSGFSPSIYWITFDQAATLVTPKGYSAVPVPKDLEAEPIIDYIKAVLGPVKSDVGDIRGQLVSPWSHIGGTVVKAVGELVGR